MVLFGSYAKGTESKDPILISLLPGYAMRKKSHASKEFMTGKSVLNTILLLLLPFSDNRILFFSRYEKNISYGRMMKHLSVRYWHETPSFAHGFFHPATDAPPE
jgi:hypothetical protein